MASVIITAGGNSSRFKGKNKLLFEYDGKPVIQHTVEKFLNLSFVEEIIIPTNEIFLEMFKKLFRYNSKIKVVKGGENRQSSVFNALCVCDKNTDFVIIHDGARPFVEKNTVIKCFNSAQINLAAIVAVKTTDTIKIVNEKGFITSTPNRNELWNAQTPQIFKYDLIFKLHKKYYGENFTDDSLLCEKDKINVAIVEGEYSNIKITTEIDVKNLI